MAFIKKNMAIILSLIVSYAIIYFTADYLPDAIHSLSGVRVGEGFFAKYRFPVVILAFLVFPIISWLKKKLVPDQ